MSSVFSMCLCAENDRDKLHGRRKIWTPQPDPPNGHLFKFTAFKTSGRCDLCWRPITETGLSCAVCRYSCHKHCESRVGATCVPIQLKDAIRNNGSVPNGSLKTVNGVTFRNRSSSVKERPLSLDMDLTYITEKIIALTYTAGANDAAYRSSVKEMSRMLKVKHADKYMILNLSERRHDISRLNKQVMEFGWPAHLAPPLEKLNGMCKAIDSWLSVDPLHIIVIHSRGDKGRTGVIVAAYMHYTNINGSADQALDRFSMKRFYDHKLAPATQPSQKRYVRYFSGMLSGAIKMNNNPIYLRQVVLHGVPEYDNKGFRPFIKVYQGQECLHTSGVYHVTDKMKKIVISLDKALALRGDILVKCYHKKVKPPARTTAFRVQFHTCAVNEESLSFGKLDLDEACNDDRFLDHCKIEFKMSFNRDKSQQLTSINDTMVPVDLSQDSVVRWNSYENFDIGPEDDPNDIDDVVDESIHHKGPLDGNLYAQVIKKQMNGCIPNLTNDPLTASMDSGISSNPGNHGNTSCNTTPNSTTNQTTANGLQTQVEVHNPPGKYEITTISATLTSTGSHNEDRANLDALINDMMLDIQSMPDVTKPSLTAYTATSTVTDSPPPLINPTTKSSHRVIGGKTVDHMRKDLDSEKPHHARSTGTPFTYGDVMKSPSMPKRYSTEEDERPNMYTKRYETGVSPSVSDPGLSWLERQQLKLKDRKDGRSTLDRRYRESRMLAELHEVKPIVHYTSDAEDDIEVDVRRSPPRFNTFNGYSPPVHKPPSGASTPTRGISAPSSPMIPNRTSSRDWKQTSYTINNVASRPVTRQKSDTSFDRERPFVIVKRSHTLARDPENQYKNGSEFVTSSPISGSKYPYVQHNVVFPGNRNGGLSPISVETDLHAYVSKPTLTNGYDANLLEMADADSVKANGKAATDKLQELESVLSNMREERKKAQDLKVKELVSQDMNSGWASDASPSPLTDDRSNTPLFQSRSRSPASSIDGSYPRRPKSPSSSRHDRSPSPATVQALKLELTNGTTPAFSTNGQSSPTVYYGQSRRSSVNSESPEVIHGNPMLARDLSKYWYKPNISREDAINMLKYKSPGTFVVRDSNSFPGAYGLALKVSMLPPNVQNKSGDMSSELVRHFLIEPTKNGVKLKGCSNEPVFGSLSALVHQHTITPLALPCKLNLPESEDTINQVVDSLKQEVRSSQSALLTQGAACNVLYLGSVDMESLTGPQAVRKAMGQLMLKKPLPEPSVVHFKVSNQGITLTDNNRKKFFRRHYPVQNISHCSMDPDDRRWNTKSKENGLPSSSNRCFGFVAKITSSGTDNQCHLFAELEPEQPASAIVSFVTKVMMADTTEQQRSQLL